MIEPKVRSWYSRGRAWTAEELSLVNQWNYEGVTQPEQARRLGRSVGSVRGAVKFYRLQGNPRKWDAEQRAAILRHLADGLAPPAIARLINRSRYRINEKVREMERAGLVRKKRTGRRFVYTLTRKWKRK